MRVLAWSHLIVSRPTVDYEAPAAICQLASTDTALDTGVDRTTDLAQRLEAILRRGHLYENVVASDNSNIHNGDRIYVTYNVMYNTSSSYGSMPMIIDRYPPDVLCDRPGQLLRKRKRATDDIEDAVRTGVGYHRRSLEMSLSSLGRPLKHHRVHGNRRKGHENRDAFAYHPGSHETS